MDREGERCIPSAVDTCRAIAAVERSFPLFHPRSAVGKDWLLLQAQLFGSGDDRSLESQINSILGKSYEQAKL